MKKGTCEAFTSQIIQFKVNYPEFFQIQTCKPGINFFRPWSKYCVNFTLFRPWSCILVDLYYVEFRY